MGTARLRVGHLFGAGRDDVTRYLCAAAHLRRQWAERVPDYLLSQTHTSIAPNAGVDLVTVLEHCFWARRRWIVRDIALWVCLLGPAAGLLVVASWIVALVSWLTERRFPALESVTDRPVGGLIVVFVLAAFVVAALHRVTTMTILADRLQRKTFDAERAVPGSRSARRTRFEEVAARQAGNVIVYRGPVPFVGAGLLLRDWTHSAYVRRPKDPKDGPARFFGTAELYDEVKNAIRGLDVAGLVVDDRLYVDGREIKDDVHFLPNRSGPPITNADTEFVRSFTDDQAGYVRQYQCIEVASWRNEMVLTVFIRFAQNGGSLFIEVSDRLLPPVWEPYREVNHVHLITDVRQLARVLVDEAVHLPATWREAVATPFRRGWDALAWWRYRVGQRRSVKTDPSFEYGAEQSLREWAMSDEYERHFQLVDTEILVKTIESRVLDTIIEFLDFRNIDTSQLRSRQVVIQNTGILVTGPLKAGVVVAGQGNTVWNGLPPGPTASGASRTPRTPPSPTPPEAPGQPEPPAAPPEPEGAG